MTLQSDRRLIEPLLDVDLYLRLKPGEQEKAISLWGWVHRLGRQFSSRQQQFVKELLRRARDRPSRLTPKPADLESDATPCPEGFQLLRGSARESRDQYMAWLQQQATKEELAEIRGKKPRSP